MWQYFRSYVYSYSYTLWIGAIKDGSFHIQKNVSSGSLRLLLVRVPEMTINVENVVAKCPRMSVLELARILNTDYGSNHRIFNRFLNLKKDKIAFKNLHMDNARPHSVKRTHVFGAERSADCSSESL